MLEILDHWELPSTFLGEVEHRVIGSGKLLRLTCNTTDRFSCALPSSRHEGEICGYCRDRDREEELANTRRADADPGYGDRERPYYMTLLVPRRLKLA